MEIREGRDTIAKFRYKGKVIVRTKVPHFIRQQLRINDKQLRGLIDCTLHRQDYEAILREKGLID